MCHHERKPSNPKMRLGFEGNHFRDQPFLLEIRTYGFPETELPSVIINNIAMRNIQPKFHLASKDHFRVPWAPLLVAHEQNKNLMNYPVRDGNGLSADSSPICYSILTKNAITNENSTSLKSIWVVRVPVRDGNKRKERRKKNTLMLFFKIYWHRD